LVADDKENLIPRSYRLPASQVEMIESLAAKQIFGSNRSGIVRTLLDRAIKELVETDYVKKHLETVKLLKK
jgi:Arc/MetJ-type ribon-helix-helix transcriptional regulator